MKVEGGGKLANRCHLQPAGRERITVSQRVGGAHRVAIGGEGSTWTKQKAALARVSRYVLS